MMVVHQKFQKAAKQIAGLPPVFVSMTPTVGFWSEISVLPVGALFDRSPPAATRLTPGET
jgi:hypothetical protein